MKILITLLAMAAIVAPHAEADTTDPVLTNFVISPAVFDAGFGPVTLDFCATVQDDFLGVFSVFVALTGTADERSGATTSYTRFSGELNLEETVCDQIVVPRFEPYNTYSVHVDVFDGINEGQYTGGALGTTNELCLVGTCFVMNSPDVGTSDVDADGVPDLADNCPDDFNDDQLDSDLDLIGDACDPFPLNLDNEQAQCEVDRDQALDDLDLCLASFDTDGDGEPDTTDLCPGTPFGHEVDTAGCSVAQFCSAIDVSVKHSSRACRLSDWRNDEPLGADDCRSNNGQCQPS